MSPLILPRIQVESIVLSLEREMGGKPQGTFDVQQAVQLHESKKKLSEQHLLASRLRSEAEALDGMINMTQTQLVNRRVDIALVDIAVVAPVPTPYRCCCRC
jgi:hypothetical protein